VDRMPPIPAEAMTQAQKDAVEQFCALRGVDIDGPFVPLLRSPGLLAPLHQVGMHCRYNNALGLGLSEFIILLVARRFSQSVEWAIHAPVALKAGVDAQTIAAVLEGRRPTTMSDSETAIYDAVHELWLSQGWSDATYASMKQQFGEAGIIDLAGTVGYYSTLAMMMNVTRTDAPGGYAMPRLP
jgi:4-carboxymuconolactone decarboxylase